MISRRLAPLSVTALCLAAFGCSSDKTAKEIAAMNTSNIQRIASMYGAFQNMKSSKGPKDEAEFKDYIKGYAPDKLAAMGIDPNNLDKTFTSERDGKPLKVRYSVGGGRGSVAPVVFEDVGVNGKRQVGFTGGGGTNNGPVVEEVDDARYKDLFSGKVSSPQSGGASAGGPPSGGPGGGSRPAGAGGGRPAGAPTGPPGGN